jgi:hypothetical protein
MALRCPCGRVVLSGRAEHCRRCRENARNQQRRQSMRGRRDAGDTARIEAVLAAQDMQRDRIRWRAER